MLRGSSRLSLLLALSTGLGCVSTKVFRTSPNIYRPVAPASVLVFPTEQDIPRSYEKIGIVYAEGDYSFNDEQDLVDSLRKKAAEIGASGIVLGGYEKPTTGAKVWNALLGTKANEKMQALVIRFTQAPPAPAR